MIRAKRQFNSFSNPSNENVNTGRSRTKKYSAGITSAMVDAVVERNDARCSEV
jgi:hypothetical protein